MLAGIFSRAAQKCAHFVDLVYFQVYRKCGVLTAVFRGYQFQQAKTQEQLDAKKRGLAEKEVQIREAEANRVPHLERLSFSAILCCDLESILTCWTFSVSRDRSSIWIQSMTSEFLIQKVIRNVFPPPLLVV